MRKVLGSALLVLVAAILFSIGVSINSSSAADSSKITIAYSGNVMGYTEPCG